jgi:hypothetical protein
VTERPMVAWRPLRGRAMCIGMLVGLCFSPTFIHTLTLSVLLVGAHHSDYQTKLVHLRSQLGNPPPNPKTEIKVRALPRRCRRWDLNMCLYV